jgi:hypothetical protein
LGQVNLFASLVKSYNITITATAQYDAASWTDKLNPDLSFQLEVLQRAKARIIVSFGNKKKNQKKYVVNK